MTVSEPNQSVLPDEADGRPVRAVVVHPELPNNLDSDSVAYRDAEARLEEACRLAEAIDLEIVASRVLKVARIRPATLMGSGQIDALKNVIDQEGAGLVVVDAPISPVQQRNLEKAFDAKVIDRTGLILEIFSARALSKEGRLQVELAHLTYQRSRLVRSWTHLERQRGALGFVGGPGETQIEADRRMIANRVAALEKQLEKVQRTRRLQRGQRKKHGLPIVALVGYTNAGKSTLFNRLTAADVVAKDMLFATLDPTLRRLDIEGGTVILSDTVGFISQLPTDLVKAFRATLEEVVEADLILHVQDITSPERRAEREDVLRVLEQIGIVPEATRVVDVWNKADLLRADEIDEWTVRAREHQAQLVSAKTGARMAELLERISRAVFSEQSISVIDLPADQGEALAWLYRNGRVRGRDQSNGSDIRVRVTLSAVAYDRFKKKFGFSEEPSDRLAAE